MAERFNPISLVWLRRDLRLHDHAALTKALSGPGSVQPVFVLDTAILAQFPNSDDRRLTFIADTLAEIHQKLGARGGGLLVLHGKAEEVIGRLSAALEASQIVAAEDFEPATIARDQAVARATGRLALVKDHLIFSPREILKEDKTPYKVFTPYSRGWLAAYTPTHAAEYLVKDAGRYADFAQVKRAAEQAGLKVLNAENAEAMLAAAGYRKVDSGQWKADAGQARLAAFAGRSMARYSELRDRVDLDGTSVLSPYLRFGQVSIREAMRAAAGVEGSGKWVSELIWREFYAMILYHFPESVQTEWNPDYRGKLGWSENAQHLAAWKEGKTGYPVVDAAMRQLRDTGWMHNRARMIVASFLTKDLLIDWRLGEEHFAQLLMDYDLASNVGGWQWAASTGTDAQPYFRIFNPELQSRKFDPAGDYIRRYVPELAMVKDDFIHAPWDGMLAPRPKNYIPPVVLHSEMRDKALAMFKQARGG